MDLLPLLDVSRSPDPDTPIPSPVGGYVRFWIERVTEELPSGSERDYRTERRHWVSRFLVGRNRARILTARLVVNRANLVTQTVTLASATHDSNRRQGENWTSELGERRFLTPFFRVDQGTTASVEVSLSASARIDPDVTRNLLSIIERGARLAAPKAPLVTSLTAPRLTETADFVDTAVSRLFGEAVAERSQNDFAADGWYRGTLPVATIAADFPMGRHVWAGGDTRSVGRWRVWVSEPIVSVFSPVPLNGAGPAAGAVCPAVTATQNEKGQAAVQPPPLTGSDFQACTAFIGLTPSRVLGLQVGDNLTLGQALRSDTGVTAALQRFPNETAERKGEAAREICVLIAERAENLGLNAYDSAAALWAFASNGGISSEISGKIWDGECTVARLAIRLGLGLSRASATEASPGQDRPPVTAEPQPQT
ncbi:MAG TPA: hypothetical protein VEX35_06990 [Allosphingosinicella sp.]|nr:hypothetical protein [Allosphingosinicella sp.]